MRTRAHFDRCWIVERTIADLGDHALYLPRTTVVVGDAHHEIVLVDIGVTPARFREREQSRFRITVLKTHDRWNAIDGIPAFAADEDVDRCRDGRRRRGGRARRILPFFLPSFLLRFSQRLLQRLLPRLLPWGRRKRRAKRAQRHDRE